jgi:hypothetical protein
VTGTSPPSRPCSPRVRQQIAAGEELLSFIADPEGFTTLGRSERLAVIARAGLRRLDQEHDLSRLLVRDLARFPDLLAEMGQDEIQPVYQVVAAWLAEQAGPRAPERDWPALAAVLVNATTHYWLLGNVYGQDPAGIDEDRYVATLAELAAGLLDGTQEEDQSHEPPEH